MKAFVIKERSKRYTILHIKIHLTVIKYWKYSVINYILYTW